jgi:sporadic carbohydrate cluster 2OG-Fe(II) oxygenase
MEKKYTQSLLKNGYFIFNIKNKNYNEIKKHIQKRIIKKSKKIKLDDLHKHIKIDKLNKLRMNLFKDINKNSNFKENIFKSAEKFIEGCVGSEICSSDVNLSIQIPNDVTSLLEMHTDFFSGESLFQVNLWIPFMNVKKTQSMFIINPIDSYKILKKIKNNKKINFKDINKQYSKNFKWLELKSGQALIFSPNCLHGNVVNKENKTRISINIRYKNIFSPYGNIKNEKKIGSFYKVLSPKAITLFNLKHNFDEIT